MSSYRNSLPQLGSTPFLTDGGLETTLIFDHHIELPEFAAFPLLLDKAQRQKLHDYYLPYIDLAKEKGVGFILESPTWRASKDWAEKLGLNEEDTEVLNCRAIELLAELRNRFEDTKTPMVISGCMGPRGDGYHVDEKMSTQQARQYHSAQISTFSRTEADLVSAFTINYVEEAIGIVLAAQDYNMPVVISFTVETDGRLPSGQPLASAIEEVDRATENGPAYYMINCAHPNHFKDVLTEGGWCSRIRAIRANASCKSHSELDEEIELDRGNPHELAKNYRDLAAKLPQLKIFGGCCGTDHHHLAAICSELTSQF